MMNGLNNLPSEYSQFIVTMEYMMNKNELNIDMLCEMLNLTYSRMSPSGSAEEKALAAKTFFKTFQEKVQSLWTSRAQSGRLLGKTRKQGRATPKWEKAQAGRANVYQ
jgi:hypothetical protein